MISKIKRILKRNKLRKNGRFLDLDEGSYYGSCFDVELRNPKENRVYLKIGQTCMVEGKFIFETEKGSIKIGDRCHIGPSTFISRDSILIGDDVTIAWDCTIYDHNSHSIYWEKRSNDTVQEYLDMKVSGNSILNKRWEDVKSAPIVIEDKAWLGFGVTVLKGVTIGEGAVVAAKSVVVKDIEPYCIVAGNPAVVVKRIKRN